MTLPGLLILVKPIEAEIETEEVECAASSSHIGKRLSIGSLNNTFEPPCGQDYLTKAIIAFYFATTL